MKVGKNKSVCVLDNCRAKGIGCLLVHGFMSTPFEMEKLKEELALCGVRAEAPLLPGHGGTAADLNETGFGDWYEAVETSYLNLRRECSKVFVIGLSLGGTLTLRLAEKHSPDGIVVLAAPVWLYRVFPWKGADWRLPFTHLLKHLRPEWPVSPPNPKSREIAPWVGLEGATPLVALSSMMVALGDVRMDLHKVKAPALIMHAYGDKTVPDANAEDIFNEIGSEDKKLVMLHIKEEITSRHILTTHGETALEVAFQSMTFMQEICEKNA